MARYGRAYPAPTRRPGPNFKGVHQDITLSSFSLDWAFPQVTIVSPSVTLPLPTFSLGWEFPSLGLAVALPTFALTWQFPAITPVVPPKPGDQLTGVDGQLEYNGFLLGSGTVYRWRQLTGWRDRPALDSGNVPRASRHGSWPGRSLAQERTITWTAKIKTPREAVEAAINALEQATPIPEDDTELPLVIRDLGTPYLTYGRLAQLGLPVDPVLRLGLGNLVLQWVCSDPRRYSLLRHGITIPAATPIQVANAGNTASHPLVRIPGPVTNPTLTNETLNRSLQFALSLSASERLDIDTDAGTVTVAGDNRMSTMTGSSVPVSDWVLGAGANALLYTVDAGGTAGMDVLWRDAWL